jgi:hypothetical protein
MKLSKRITTISGLFIGIAALLWPSTGALALEPQVQYFPQIADGGGYTATLSFTGYGTGPSTIDVEIFDKDGYRLSLATDRGTGNTLHLSLNGYGSAVLHTLGMADTVSSGWVRVTSSPPVGATLAYKYVGRDGLISNASVLPSTPSQSVTLFVPDARNTAIAVLSPGYPNILSFRLLDTNGNPVGPASTYSLQAWNRAALYVNQIPGYENAEVLNGSLEVSGTEVFSIVTLIFDEHYFATAPVMAGRMIPVDEHSGFVNQFTQLLQRTKEMGDQLLPPTAEDLTGFGNFLSQPQTGLIRLLPRETYDGYLTIRGGGAYYSFARLTHEYGYGSDLELYYGNLSVGFAGGDFGFMTNLGDVAIDDVTLDHPAIQYLAALVPPMLLTDARVQQQRASTGFSIGPYYFRDSMRATQSTTYALRSLCFGTSDVLVVFRVVRIDVDGSVILAWKLLNKYSLPRLQ